VASISAHNSSRSPTERRSRRTKSGPLVNAIRISSGLPPAAREIGPPSRPAGCRPTKLRAGCRRIGKTFGQSGRHTSPRCSQTWMRPVRRQLCDRKRRPGGVLCDGCHRFRRGRDRRSRSRRAQRDVLSSPRIAAQSLIERKSVERWWFPDAVPATSGTPDAGMFRSSLSIPTDALVSRTEE
jgi:hypothetical protein